MCKRFIVMSLTVAALSHSAISYAHSQTGALADNPTALLGNVAGTVDSYQVTCSSDGATVPAGLISRVKDLTEAASPRVSIHAQKDGGQLGYVASTSTDDSNNDSNYSPWGVVVGGVGVYTLLVSKDAVGSQLYSFEAHCMSWQGVETGTDIVQIQNQ
jgi:hypothetical protein